LPTLIFFFILLTVQQVEAKQSAAAGGSNRGYASGLIRMKKKINVGKPPTAAGLSLQAHVLDHLVRKSNNNEANDVHAARPRRRHFYRLGGPPAPLPTVLRSHTFHASYLLQHYTAAIMQIRAKIK
jgi:hypothetical protein